MAIEFLQVSPEEAVIRLQRYAESGYALRHAMQGEYDRAGHGNITDTMITDWINRINSWTEETKQVLLSIYSSPNYMFRFLEVSPNIISTAEDRRFTDSKSGLLVRIGTLNSYIEFIIQHANPSFTFQNNVTLLHLNPKRDLNIAQRDINTESI